MASKKGKPARSRDVEVLLTAVVDERGDDTIIVVVPSHGGPYPQAELPDQDQWAEAALKLFGRLYRGATAFRAARGIWVDADGNEMFDEPIFVESLVRREDAENESKLDELAEFARRMCRDTRQECVAVICNDTIHYVYPDKS